MWKCVASDLPLRFEAKMVTTKAELGANLSSANLGLDTFVTLRMTTFRGSLLAVRSSKVKF